MVSLDYCYHNPAYKPPFYLFHHPLYSRQIWWSPPAWKACPRPCRRPCRRPCPRPCPRPCRGFPGCRKFQVGPEKLEILWVRDVRFFFHFFILIFWICSLVPLWVFKIHLIHFYRKYDPEEISEGSGKCPRTARPGDIHESFIVQHDRAIGTDHSGDMFQFGHRLQSHDQITGRVENWGSPW